MPGRFGWLRRKPQASSWSTRCARKFSSSALVATRVSLVISVRGRVCVGGGPPLVGQHHHRLRQIERHEAGVQRVAHQRVGFRHVVIVEPRALRAEQDAGAQVPRADRAQLGRGPARGQHRLDDVARARAGGEHAVEVGDGIRDRRDARSPRRGCGRRPRRSARPSPAASRRAARRAAGGTARHSPWRARPRRYCRQAAAGPAPPRGCCRWERDRRPHPARSFGRTSLRVLLAVLGLPAAHERDLLLLRGDDLPRAGGAAPGRCRNATPPAPCPRRPDGAGSWRRRNRGRRCPCSRSFMSACIVCIACL